MRTIRISEEVWSKIAERGRFGETPDDVLRRVFNINKDSNHHFEPRRRFATHRMTSRIVGKDLSVSFLDGPSKKWPLPSKEDKLAIRRIRDEAISFASMNGATEGQRNAIKKTLTDSGYHLTK